MEDCDCAVGWAVAAAKPAIGNTLRISSSKGEAIKGVTLSDIVCRARVQVNVSWLSRGKYRSVLELEPEYKKTHVEFCGANSFLFGLLASGARARTVSVVLCQRLNGASILLGDEPKAAFVQLVQRKKIT